MRTYEVLLHACRHGDTLLLQSDLIIILIYELNKSGITHAKECVPRWCVLQDIQILRVHKYIEWCSAACALLVDPISIANAKTLPDNIAKQFFLALAP